ncbi:IS30 family transposase [Enterococcus hirae]
MSSYARLTDLERVAIAAYYQQEYSLSEIGRFIGRPTATISREIKRNKKEDGSYEPAFAQELTNSRRANCKNRSKFTKEIKWKIESKLAIGWSPVMICMFYRKTDPNFVSAKTIYRYIREGKVGAVECLRRKGRPYKRKSDVNRMKGGRSIHDRPIEANTRERIGDWEIDTVVGPRGTTHVLVTVVDRCTRKLLAKVEPDRKAETVTNSLVSLLKDEIVYTITADNGKEFSNYREIEERLGVPVYFADPYCSWQRGSNENTNGLLREYVPKGLDIGTVTQEALDYYVHLINTRPRKIFSFISALEKYQSSA